MNWIDTHTHLYLPEFDSDRVQVMENCANKGVVKLLLPNIESSTFSAMYSMKNNFPSQVELMLGLHPCSVKENYKEELYFIEDRLNDINIIGIGEIGLDLYWDKTTFEIQKIAFIQQLLWSKKLELPVSIHSREATQEAIECIKEVHGKVKGVFHCFSGTIEQAKEIISLGMYLGIGGVVTYKNTNLSEIIRAVGLESLVLETDSPYLSPIPFRGKRNESSYIPTIGARIAEILDLSLNIVAEQTTKNALQIFNRIQI